MKHLVASTIIIVALLGCGNDEFSGERGEIDTEILNRCALPIEPVIIFTTTWCSTCKTLKQRMNSQRIAFHEIDAEKNTEMFSCVGGKYYPWLLVEGRVVNIASGQALEKALRPYATR
ncbi:MAG: hypothetical protein CR977_02075 [Gammaproteobacteria bacterium]|nr:MAG: hypothetical protein CR977_02075 [Gammaproteobacteria bacterium]